MPLTGKDDLLGAVRRRLWERLFRLLLPIPFAIFLSVAVIVPYIRIRGEAAEAPHDSLGYYLAMGSALGGAFLGALAGWLIDRRRLRFKKRRDEAGGAEP